MANTAVEKYLSVFGFLVRCTVLGTTLIALGQGQSKMFEVASVKVATSPGRIQMRGGPGTSDPGRISYNSVPLKPLIFAAYSVADFQLKGPAWLESERYDISAVIPAGTSSRDFQAMMRQLMEDRFHLAVHRESKEVSGYRLVVGKKGPGLKASTDESVSTGSAIPPHGAAKKGLGQDRFPQVAAPVGSPLILRMNGKVKLAVRQVTLPELAAILAAEVDRAVVDATGLSAKYDVTLYYVPEQPSRIQARAGVSQEEVSGITLERAVEEQLGLRLEKGVVSIQYLVVDRVERIPAGN
jgi:uncharacterized protein (TIGR03435 family)